MQLDPDYLELPAKVSTTPAKTVEGRVGTKEDAVNHLRGVGFGDQIAELYPEGESAKIDRLMAEGSSGEEKALTEEEKADQNVRMNPCFVKAQVPYPDRDKARESISVDSAKFRARFMRNLQSDSPVRFQPLLDRCRDDWSVMSIAVLVEKEEEVPRFCDWLNRVHKAREILNNVGHLTTLTSSQQAALARQMKRLRRMEKEDAEADKRAAKRRSQLRMRMEARGKRTHPFGLNINKVGNLY